MGKVWCIPSWLSGSPWKVSLRPLTDLKNRGFGQPSALADFPGMLSLQSLQSAVKSGHLDSTTDDGAYGCPLLGSWHHSKLFIIAKVQHRAAAPWTQKPCAGFFFCFFFPSSGDNIQPAFAFRVIMRGSLGKDHFRPSDHQGEQANEPS